MMDKSHAQTEKLVQYKIEKKTLEDELHHTFIFQPTVSIGANMDVPFSAANANLSITLGIDLLKAEERKSLKDEIDIKEREIQEELSSIEFQLKMAEESIHVANVMLDLNSKDVETTQTNSKKADFLLKQGERTSLEGRQALLSYDLAVIREYKASANLYSAQADFLILF